MNSIRAFVDAVEAFVEQLASVAWIPLCIATAFSVANLLLRARGWQNILRASYPDETLPYRDVMRSYLSGVGVNAVIPARVGDIVKLFMLKRRAPRTRYPGLAGSLVLETAFDWVIGVALLVWALQAGVLPGLPRLPTIPAFDLSWAFRNPEFVAIITVGVIVLGWLLLRRVQSFWREFGAGFAIVRTPRRFAQKVLTWQIAAFGTRLGGAYFFLEAFGLPATLEGALIVQAAGALASLFPATPGGLGPKQALLVVMLAGEATRSEVLAFSVGSELALLIMNAVVGLAALVSLAGTFRIRGAISEARAARAAEGDDP